MYSINGVGTATYGRKELPDGTCITTKWLIIFFYPILPLGSYRVTHVGERQQTFYGWSYPMAMERVPLDIRMVARVYSWTLGIPALIAIVAWAATLR